MALDKKNITCKDLLLRQTSLSPEKMAEIYGGGPLGWIQDAAEAVWDGIEWVEEKIEEGLGWVEDHAIDIIIVAVLIFGSNNCGTDGS